MSAADNRRRDLLKKAAILGSGGVAGAALIGGLDRTVFAGPSSSIAAFNQGDAIGTASVIVWADSSGNYYVKDAGIGSSPGALIVNANVITAYGHSLGAGTSGTDTTSAGIQEAINSVGAAGGGTVHIKAHPSGYQLGTGVTDGGYDGIMLRGDGLASLMKCGAGSDFDLMHIDKSDWVIQGLSLNGTGQTAGHHCIDLGTASKNCQVLDNFITGGGYYDILAQGMGHILERNMASASGHDCLVLSAATDCIVANNVCDTPGLDNCIALVTCTNILVSRNVCINAVASGVGLENQGAGPCSRCSVVGNILISSQH
ncbi:MAG TPA: hypothetical protein VGR71_04735, partial [Nitrospira sp.]|nr:hypothetical protein [Nitrospira sp.]